MTRSNDSGFTVAELLVAVALLGIIISVSFLAMQVVRSSNDVTERQAQFSRNVSTPLHVMDKVLSQNRAIENGGGRVSDAYTVTTRSPLNPDTSTYTRHIFSAGADGSLTERVWRVSVANGSEQLIKTNVWSTENANRAGGVVKGALFRYLDANGATAADVTQARSVLVEVWTENDGRYFRDRRQIYFRNR